MKFKKFAFVALIPAIFMVSDAIGQDRPRIVRTVSSQPVNAPTQDPTPPYPVSKPVNRPPMTTDIVVVRQAPLVEKTSSSRAISGSMAAAGSRSVYNQPVTNAIMRGIQSRLGIPYRYGSSGPNRYDCSGFIWSVYRDAGLSFARTSARSLWHSGEPVYGEERFKFGTLVFLNKLGHIGIVADENGFYHASSSKGITYSPFKGYWEKRIVGFRRLSNNLIQPSN